MSTASGPAQPSSIDRQEGRRRAAAKKSVVVVVLGLGIILFACSEWARDVSLTDRQTLTHRHIQQHQLTCSQLQSQVSLDAADMQGVHVCFREDEKRKATAAVGCTSQRVITLSTSKETTTSTATRTNESMPPISHQQEKRRSECTLTQSHSDSLTIDCRLGAESGHRRDGCRYSHSVMHAGRQVGRWTSITSAVEKVNSSQVKSSREQASSVGECEK